MNINELSIKQLNKAVSLKEKIAKLEAKLLNLTGTTSKEPASPKKRKGGMSAEGRARIAAAQKLRWAKINGAKSPVQAAPKARKKISAAGIARIKAAQKARWAKIKAEKTA